MFDVPGQIELDGDAADLFAGLAREGANAFDVVDFLLEPLRDFGFDDVGIGAGVNGRDGDDWGIDVRQFTHRQPRERDHSEQHNRQAHHRGEHGALDADAGEDHYGRGGLGR